MKTYKQFISEMFDYKPDLRRNSFSTDDFETWAARIGDNDYNFSRTHRGGVYAVNFTRGGSFERSPIPRSDSSKVFSVAKALMQEKLDQGHPIKILAYDNGLADFYENAFHKMNKREYNGKLHVNRDFRDIYITHIPLPRTVDDVKDEMGVHYILDHEPTNNICTQLLQDKGHLLNDDILGKIANYRPNLIPVILRDHMPKLSKLSVTKAVKNASPSDMPECINHIINNAKSEQLSDSTREYMDMYATPDQRTLIKTLK